MSEKTFKDLELEGWLERASSYEIIAPVTNQATGPILDQCGNIAGRDVLEVACGPGHLAAEAARRGANVTAIDFAQTMVDNAAATYPDIDFNVGDAESLALDDQSYDVVVCAFGLLHLEHPIAAIEESHRVLRPGGRYVFSVWYPPEEGGAFFGFLMGAIQTHGNLDLPLPPAPSFYQFADRGYTEQILSEAGFTDFQWSSAPVVWRGEQPRDAVDVIYKATVRTKMILEAQTEDARAAIHQAIIDGMDEFRVGEHYEIAMPAVIVSARRGD